MTRVGIKKKSKGTKKGHSYVAGAQDGPHTHSPSISFPLLAWPDQFLPPKLWLLLPHSTTVQAWQYDMWMPDAHQMVDLTDKAWVGPAAAAEPWQTHELSSRFLSCATNQSC